MDEKAQQKSYWVFFSRPPSYDRFWDNGIFPKKCDILLVLAFDDLCWPKCWPSHQNELDTNRISWTIYLTPFPLVTTLLSFLDRKGADKAARQKLNLSEAARNRAKIQIKFGFLLSSVICSQHATSIYMQHGSLGLTRVTMWPWHGVKFSNWLCNATRQNFEASRWKKHDGIFSFPLFLPAPAGFVNLQGVLLQSSKWLGISSVQFGSIVTSLSGKFVQFNSGHGGQVTPSSSVHSFHFANSSGPDSAWPGWFVSAQARFSQSSFQLFRRSRGAVLGPLQRQSQPAGPGFVARVERWRALLAVLVCLSGVWCVVTVTQFQFKTV